MGTKVRQRIFLTSSVIGLASTWYFNIAFFLQEKSFNILLFFKEAYISDVSRSLTHDIAVVAFVFLFWAGSEARRHRMKYFWAYPLMTVFIALAFAMPLFMYYREKAIERNKASALNTTIP